MTISADPGLISRRWRRLILVVGFLGILALTLAVRRAVVGRDVCNVSFRKAKESLVHACAIPEGGSKYSVSSNVRVTRVVVAIDEDVLREWLKFRHATFAEQENVVQGVSGFCGHASWVITIGWNARVIDEGTVTHITYDSNRHCAYLGSHD